MLLSFLKKLFNLQCNHQSAIALNANFCPDCGKRIIQKWSIIKCKKCGHYRTPVPNSFDNIKPLKKYCFHCGSDKWTTQNYHNHNIPDSLKQISINYVVSEKENNYKFGELTEKTKIWISKPAYNHNTQKVNK